MRHTTAKQHKNDEKVGKNLLLACLLLNKKLRNLTEKLYKYYKRLT